MPPVTLKLLLDKLIYFVRNPYDRGIKKRMTIHYNCIGAFEVPDRRKIPERDILLETRKNMASSCAFAQIVMQIKK